MDVKETHSHISDNIFVEPIQRKLIISGSFGRVNSKMDLISSQLANKPGFGWYIGAGVASVISFIVGLGIDSIV